MRMDSTVHLRIPNRMRAMFAQKARETGFSLSEVIRQAAAAGIARDGANANQERAR